MLLTSRLACHFLPNVAVEKVICASSAGVGVPYEGEDCVLAPVADDAVVITIRLNRFTRRGGASFASIEVLEYG